MSGVSRMPQPRALDLFQVVVVDEAVAADGTPHSYFMKVATGEVGLGMLRGKFHGATEIYKYITTGIPRPVSWGTYRANPETHFYLCDFIEMAEEISDVRKFCAMLAKLHHDSMVSDDAPDAFGFHVVTYGGKMWQDVTWCELWEDSFRRQMQAFIDQERVSQGPSVELEELLPPYMDKVIPRLLRPLQSHGRKIKPVLVHGDIWYGNIATDTGTGEPLLFDPSAIWGHNEGDLGNMNTLRYRMGRRWMDEYHKFFPISAPKEDYEDRNIVYAIRGHFCASTLHPDKDIFRKMLISEIKRLVDKYPTTPSVTSTPSPPPRRSATPKLLALALVTASAIYYLTTDDSAPSSSHIFNDHRFTPFTLTARDPVSPTSFILTLKPSSPLSPSEVAAQIAAPWSANDLWSLEVKQPQLQIAREYTPLPNAPPDALRFLVRAIHGGEVSTYLSRLPVGAKVDLRGPHGSFDLAARLRPDGRVLFLAGGTGIASALQAAHALLAAPHAPNVTILWAVRSRDEIQSTAAATPTPSRPWWNPFHTPQPEFLTPAIASPTPTTQDLLALQARHPENLKIRLFVDGETALAPPLLADALRAAPPAHDEAATCALHAQRAHIGVADGAPNAGARDRFPGGACVCPTATGSGEEGQGPAGKNLLLVSGPDGFIKAFAGGKPWRGGGQVQGAVGGVLGQLEKREAGLLRDWLVLKL
ncbi:hypothetical protein ACHAQA_008292 [Verticillium albo-atrum]